MEVMTRKRSDSSAAREEGSELSIKGRKVTLTRLSKVLYPATGTTKAEIIDYYLRVSGFLLPHLKNHPVTLKRYPDGVKAEAFWDKDAPSFAPAWVKTFPVPRHAGGPDINYILINDLATLAWVANIAALELHPFLHRVPKLNVPTSIVFDLDPGTGANILKCIEVAFLIREVFDGLNLQSFPKVSGSKGLQVYIPLNTPTSYEITQPFAKTVAELVEKQHPHLAVSIMAKEKRIGKVFIDWSQNADHKTTVGVYSLRAKRERPLVSMPVTWQELESTLQRKGVGQLEFEPAAALARLEKVGDLFAPVLILKQTLPHQVTDVIQEQNKRAHPPQKSLREYDKKRSFSNTPEPMAIVPRRSSQGGRRRFVIQKHAASHLHYDFRLEMGGVLKSWAVPKAVPYEVGVRRLASATEDHPLEYLDFEGTIPAGQYGGGTVMVWDIGTYELIEGNYWKGTLHLSLAGKKLKGEWLLTKDEHKGNNAWILEKVTASMKPLSLKLSDTSALSSRTMAQIADANDAQWQSNRVPRLRQRKPPRPASSRSHRSPQSGGQIH
jgi:bifunctional non-homologous end joining protein LigD